MKILLVGGGSGGHITPLLAVAHKIKETDSEIKLYGACEKNSKFSKLYLDDKNIDKLYYISAGKFRRYSNQSFISNIFDLKTNFLNFIDFFKTIAGIISSVFLLIRVKPDAILVKGGFVAVPIGLAAALLKIEFCTHDSDTSPGLANRIVSKWARYNLTGMPAQYYNYPKAKIRYVGIPLSEHFKVNTKQEVQTYKRELDIPVESKVLTVVGGSLGAKTLNKLIMTIIEQLLEIEDLYIIHVTGENNYKETNTFYHKKLSMHKLSRLKVFGFVEDLYKKQAVADIVVSRGGATQLSELAIQAKPTIIIPAKLADDHQTKNAKYYKDSKAAEVIDTNKYNEQELLNKIHLLIKNQKIADNLSNNIKKLAVVDSSKVIADLLLEIRQ